MSAPIETEIHYNNQDYIVSVITRETQPAAVAHAQFYVDMKGMYPRPAVLIVELTPEGKTGEAKAAEIRTILRQQLIHALYQLFRNEHHCNLLLNFHYDKTKARIVNQGNSTNNPRLMLVPELPPPVSDHETITQRLSRMPANERKAAIESFAAAGASPVAYEGVAIDPTSLARARKEATGD